LRALETGILNGPALQQAARILAHAVAAVIQDRDFPIVLAGDCSVILGALLGLKWAARSQLLPTRFGLLFIDGHVDFYQPSASPTGEVADMDLAIATGRGPAILTELDGKDPLVPDDDVIAVGARDAEEREKAHSQDIRTTNITLFELPTIRAHGIESVATNVSDAVSNHGTQPFWCHVDADVLDDNIMPAVDYRQPGGLKPKELTALLRRAAQTKCMAGLSVAIYNPTLDPSGDCARMLVDVVVHALESLRESA
jgi:arginase